MMGKNEERIKVTFAKINTHYSNIPSFQKRWQKGTATRYSVDDSL
jgi:hypothetical protein